MYIYDNTLVIYCKPYIMLNRCPIPALLLGVYKQNRCQMPDQITPQGLARFVKQTEKDGTVFIF